LSDSPSYTVVGAAPRPINLASHCNLGNKTAK
jgi:hypothetical protein